MKFNYLKTLSVQAAEQLRFISSEGTHAMRQSRCAMYLRYAIDKDTWWMSLNKANFCKQRSCPVCCWLKSAKWRIRIFQGLPRLLVDYPGFPFLFLTLTVRNCHLSELRSCVRSMQESWHRLAVLPYFPAIGYLKSLEISRPRDCFYSGHYLGRFGKKLINFWQKELKRRGIWEPRLWSQYLCEDVHPHIHVLMMVRPDYWSQENYISHPEWVSLWKRSANLDYQPVVDIRKVQELNSGILEVSKYCLKTSDMVDRLGCLINRQLHGTKLLHSCGAFGDYFSQKVLDKVDRSLVLGNEYTQNGVPCMYEWNGEQYCLTQLGNLRWQLD